MRFENETVPALRMEGYYVWCGSPIKGDDGKYHLFSSRWERKYSFSPGWLLHSEVVHSVSDTPFGPYSFHDVVLPARGPEYWDGCATHCPYIVRYGKKYLLFYTGFSYPLEVREDNRKDVAVVSRASKRIGFAIADSPYGPWQRSDTPALPTRPGTFYSYLTSNPAPCVEDDGSITLMFKSRSYLGREQSGQFIGAARAEALGAPFKVLTDYPLFGKGSQFTDVEDPFLWRDGSTYHMLAKDMYGAICGTECEGCEFISSDAIHWQYLGKAYSLGKHALRERSSILFDENKKPIALFNAVADKYPYSDPAAETWNGCARPC